MQKGSRSKHQVNMETGTEVIYTSHSMEKNNTRRSLKYKKSLLLRCGIVLVTLLAFYVLLTVYSQLRQASELLLEMKRQNLALDANKPKLWKNTNLHNTKQDARSSTSQMVSDIDDKIFDRILDLAKSQNESQFTEDDLGQAIRRRFQENVYMIRKRFYESHQSKRHISENAGLSNGNYVEPQAVTRIESSELPREFRVGNSKTRANVIIVAYHRSGSSFLGEMFNRDPNAFYIFEPIHTIDAVLDARRRFPILYDTLIRSLLDTIFKCDFRKDPLFVNTLTSSSFRLKSQALTSKGLCDPRATSKKMHLCRRINATFLTNVCSSRPHTVIKTIRMAHWENIDFLVDTSPTPFKVIHLVRDPRGIIASRVAWLLDRFPRNVSNTSRKEAAIRNALLKYVRIMSQNLCQQMANDINDWTKRAKKGEHYAMVRYEDISGQPLTIYKKISKFVGGNTSESVIGWLKINTKSSSNSDYYSTTRNSSAVPHLWRRRLTMPMIDEIQNNCAGVMGILGYKIVHEEKELGDLRQSLVIDWDNYGFIRTKPYMHNGAKPIYKA
ncbi:carbohydrate sulfotransferase 1-like [Dendronephthya gigantea]|uniref:carbohydrate sulfotransferase 1-like n=1 Tax=Dendronephthya gigantea TaxID=151771 RepID=UPI00106D6870|nr:carbohydrate sulfotransferase 1-like [Dendronephthya gigantea]